MKHGLKLVVACALVACGPPQNNNQNVVKGTLTVRGVFDLTGATTDIGAPYFKGLYDLMRETNANGGIRGYQVEMEYVDYKYVVATALSQYDTWKADPSWAKVITVFGWGTPDTVQLRDRVTADQMPYLSGSYAASLSSPSPVSKTVTLPDNTTQTITTNGAPYNFFQGTDYSSSARIAMDFMKKRGAKKVAAAFCENAYCMEPIAAAKIHAQSIGLTVAPDIRPLAADSVTVIDDKLKAYFTANPDVDFIWIGNTRPTTLSIMKALRKYAPNAKAVANVWAVDETLYDQCGADCVGSIFGVLPFAAYGDTRFAGMERVVELHDKYRGLDGEDVKKHQNLRYVQGHVTYFAWMRAIERIVDSGSTEFSGPAVKAAFETFKNVETGGLSAPLSYSPTDHRPTAGARLYSVNTFGKLQFEDELSVQMLADWLGW